MATSMLQAISSLDHQEETRILVILVMTWYHLITPDGTPTTPHPGGCGAHPGMPGWQPDHPLQHITSSTAPPHHPPHHHMQEGWMACRMSCGPLRTPATQITSQIIPI